MNQLKKIVTCAMLITSMTVSTVGPALSYDSQHAEDAAQALKVLSLFKGNQNGFELDRVPTRLEALIMLIRMTGQENAALSGQFQHPFADNLSWDEADRYIGYAYENKLALGINDTEFGYDHPATAQMYVTFMLRALGYEDLKDATVWDSWQVLAKNAGILPQSVNINHFKRGDLVTISYAALSAKVQEEDIALSEKLINTNAIAPLSLDIANSIMGKEVTKDSDIDQIVAHLYADVSDKVYVQGLNAQKITKDNIKFFLGTDKISFDEGIAVEPMMSSRAHSVCIIRLPRGSDVAKAKEEIKNNVDPRKWICVGVEPENVYVESVGNLILLAMDNHAAGDIATAFRKLDKNVAVPDANGMMLVDKTYIKQPDAVDSSSIDLFAQKVMSLNEKYFDENQSVWYSVIPDKSFYAKDKVLSYMDQDAITKALNMKLPDVKQIVLTDTLTLDDYYLTDPHWKQNSLFKVVSRIGSEMGFTIDKNAFDSQSYDDFKGIYQRWVDGIKPERLTYLVSKYTENAQVKNSENKDKTSVYDKEMLEGESAYNVFLSGATPLSVIENPSAKRQKELVMFRDSFASSLAPLLLEQYSKVTLVDLRYMSSELLPKYVDFKGADILFILGANIVNNSMLLK